MTLFWAIVILALVVLLVGALPRWSYSYGWGYGPSAMLAIILGSLAALLLLGRA